MWNSPRKRSGFLGDGKHGYRLTSRARIGGGLANVRAFAEMLWGAPRIYRELLKLGFAVCHFVRLLYA
jgi:hypothetical protein